MPVKLSIGEFSRMTHLSVKALRHYHDWGLLKPADVDARTGYRSYHAAQVPTAQVIRRFRDLGMPIEQVKAILEAPDLGARNVLIVEHLRRMEAQLERTQTNVSSLRRLLEATPTGASVEYRSVPNVRAASITKTVRLDEIEPWWSDAFVEIERALGAARVPAAGPRGGLYPTELFAHEVGGVTVFVPISHSLEARGRVRVTEIPPAELAVALHEGPLREADRTYGPLGTHVAEQRPRRRAPDTKSPASRWSPKNRIMASARVSSARLGDAPCERLGTTAPTALSCRPNMNRASG